MPFSQMLRLRQDLQLVRGGLELNELELKIERFIKAAPKFDGDNQLAAELGAALAKLQQALREGSSSQ